MPLVMVTAVTLTAAEGTITNNLLLRRKSHVDVE